MQQYIIENNLFFDYINCDNMSITFTINPSSTELLCKPNPVYLYNYNLFHLKILNMTIKNINIKIKNISEYVLRYNNYKSIEKIKLINRIYYYSKLININNINHDINFISISTYIKTKEYISKTRNIMNMTYIYPLYIYSYFIYNKYYNIYDHTKYYYNTFLFIGYDDFKINETKIFNCRDLYKIYSFI
jgi:hypothetical protein